MELDDHILLEEDGLILLNKPAGLPSTGATLEAPGNLQHELMQRYRRMIWAVHQLDRDTSGLNVFVRRKALVQEWTARMKRGQKHYLALCHGVVAPDHQVVDEPLGWIAARRRRGITAEGTPARSELRVLGRGEEATLLQVILHTGRSHQVRLHLEHLGHPLLGEDRYREPPSQAAPRQMLHAWRLELDGRTLEAPLPADFEATARAFALADALPQP